MYTMKAHVAFHPTCHPAQKFKLTERGQLFLGLLAK